MPVCVNMPPEIRGVCPSPCECGWVVADVVWPVAHQSGSGLLLFSDKVLLSPVRASCHTCFAALAGVKWHRFCSIALERKTSTTRCVRSGRRAASAARRAALVGQPPTNQTAWNGLTAWPVASGWRKPYRSHGLK